MSSGTNRLVRSENAMKGGSQEDLAKDLNNANEVAKGKDKKDAKKAK